MLGAHITPETLYPLIGTARAPVLIDVRRAAVFDTAADTLPAARRGDHATTSPADLGPAPNGVVCYCAHGHNVGQMAAARLRAAGVEAAWLEGGIEAWREAGLPLIAHAPEAAGRFGAGTIWVTRVRPKVDRVACPWFIRRFVDDRARFLFVEGAYVLDVAKEAGGVAFDVEGAPVTHDGPRCAFDTLLDRYGVADPHLRRLALVVRGADTASPELAPQAAGLLALSLGASALGLDDHAMLSYGFHFYDALYAFLRFADGEAHNWPPKA